MAKGPKTRLRHKIRGSGLAKTEWGEKHVCTSCGSKFYDMRQTADTCPNCGTKFKVSNTTAGYGSATKTKSTAGQPKPAEPESTELEDTNDEDLLDDEIQEDLEVVEDEEDVAEVIEVEAAVGQPEDS